VVANATPLTRKERMLVAVAGIIPDADGLGIVGEVLTKNSTHPLTWWSDYHHVLGHNIGFCLLVTAAGYAMSTSRWKTAALVFISFHLHLLGDVVGARGPDGYQWPIPYLMPFSHGWTWTWAGQWALNAWQNIVITATAMAITLYLAWKRGYSPLEMFSQKADKVFVETVRKRVPVQV